MRKFTICLIVALILWALLPFSIDAQTARIIIPEARIPLATYTVLTETGGVLINVDEPGLEVAVTLWFQLEDSTVWIDPSYPIVYEAGRCYLSVKQLWDGEEASGTTIAFSTDSTGDYTIDPTVFILNEPEWDPADVNRDGTVGFGDLWIVAMRILRPY